MFHTGSGKQIEFVNVPDTILAYYNRHKDLTNIKIIIGTDSQNFSDTKMVSVICVIAAGRGGIFFYNISRIDRIVDVSIFERSSTFFVRQFRNIGII